MSVQYKVASTSLGEEVNVYDATISAADGLRCPPPTSESHSGYVNIGAPDHTYRGFVAGPITDTTEDADKILADTNQSIGHTLDWQAWTARADQIRMQAWDRQACYGNLSLALNGLGAAYQAGAAGASTLLTLLPTAGALIGAPAKELWVLYKLVPMAGVLSMMLSLGGNIVPTEVNEYERTNSFHVDEPQIPTEKVGRMTQAEVFGKEVKERLLESHESRRGLIAIGMLLQLLWLGCILTGCWFVQSGAIVVFWCNNQYWAFFWFATVIFSSILDNITGVPFSKYWTIRVSRAPTVRIGDDAPWVVDERPPVPEKEPILAVQEVSSSRPMLQQAYSDAEGNPFLGSLTVPAETGLLAGLKEGYEPGTIIVDGLTSGESFCVIVALRGLTTLHAAARVLSKLVSVCTFAVGTSIFASTTLITILGAMITAILILVGGVFGRVTAMWMASVVMHDKPVIQRVVNTRAEAEQYMDAMLRVSDAVFEIEGHVVVNGRCVGRYGKARWSKVLGVLASPFSLKKLV